MIFAEIPQPQNLLSAVYDHKLVARLEALDQVRAAMEKKPYLDFKAGVAIVESQMGLPWRKIVGQAMGGGVSVAVDAKTQGVAILARATDKTIHAKLLETLANLASLDAKSKGKPDPVKTSRLSRHQSLRSGEKQIRRRGRLARHYEQRRARQTDRRSLSR